MKVVQRSLVTIIALSLFAAHFPMPAFAGDESYENYDEQELKEKEAELKEQKENEKELKETIKDLNAERDSKQGEEKEEKRIISIQKRKKTELVECQNDMTAIKRRIEELRARLKTRSPTSTTIVRKEGKSEVCAECNRVRSGMNFGETLVGIMPSLAAVGIAGLGYSAYSKGINGYYNAYGDYYKQCVVIGVPCGAPTPYMGGSMFGGGFGLGNGLGWGNGLGMNNGLGWGNNGIGLGFGLGNGMGMNGLGWGMNAMNMPFSMFGNGLGMNNGMGWGNNGLGFNTGLGMGNGLGFNTGLNNGMYNPMMMQQQQYYLMQQNMALAQSQYQSIYSQMSQLQQYQGGLGYNSYCNPFMIGGSGGLNLGIGLNLGLGLNLGY
jgi:cell division protein FtsB